MTDKTDLLPMPEGKATGMYRAWSYDQMREYARANVAHAVAPLQAEIEGLRAEVERLRADRGSRERQTAPPEITHCDNCGCDWLDNGLNPVGCSYCKQHTIAAQAAEIERLREELSKMRAAEPSDDEIDAIATSMADGAGGMLKQWGYRQFARALLARYGAQPVTRTEPSSGLGTIEYSVRAPETTKAFSDPAVRAAWTLGPVSDTQPKRRPYNTSGSLSEYGVFPECDAAPAAMRKEG